MSSTKGRNIMDEIREVMRFHHYSIHTERSYCDRIKRSILFYKMKSRDEPENGELKIEQFLTHLAAAGHVSPSTQNQTMNALVFLYRKVLKQELDQKIDAVRAKNRETVPVVMTREEVARVIGFMQGIPQLAAKLLYGSGLRIAKSIRLRVQDIDFELKSITVRSGKGDKDRTTTFPASVIPLLKHHLAGVKMLHDQDLAKGYGKVYLPYAPERKYKNADKEWKSQQVSPSPAPLPSG